jgi:hypothetical protein
MAVSSTDAALVRRQQAPRSCRVRNRRLAGRTGMSDHTTHISALPVDDAWLHDWAVEGIAALERYLAKQAAFAAFLAVRGLRDPGDGNSAATS